MKKILALLLACIMLTAVLTGCGNKRASTETAAQPATAEQTDATASDGATYTLKLAHDANTTSAYQLSALELKRMIEEKSDGRIKVEVYPAQQLGSAQEMIEGMQMGTIEATLLPTAKFGGFDQTMNILDMPFLFPDEDTLYEIMNGELGEQVMAGLPDIGIRGCAFYGNGFKAITNNIHPIESPDDLKGLKIRVPAVELQLAAFRSWGVEPHPLAWSETFNGLQQGVVDGQENPHAINRDQKFWEVQKYITNIHYMLWVGPMLVSDPWFRKLDPQTKALVEKAAKEAAAYEWKWSAEQDEIALKECLARGMVINDVSDEPAWTEAARSVWPQFYDKVGGKAVVDEALAIMQQ
mgnify:CR=1 FL=1